MRGLTIRIITASLTFFVGLATVSLWSVYQRPTPCVIKTEAYLPLQAPPRQRTYWRGLSASGPHESFITFNSYDGFSPMSVTKWTVSEGSPARAKKELQTVLSKASEIVSREPRFNVDLQQIGGVVIATFPQGYDGAGPASMLWTDGSKFIHVDSETVENILEYRKDFSR